MLFSFLQYDILFIPVWDTKSKVAAGSATPRAQQALPLANAANMVWNSLKLNGPFFYERMSSAVDGMFLHGGCKFDMADVEALRLRQYMPAQYIEQSWLRIPNHSPQQSVQMAERLSWYGSISTTQSIVGFHRVSWDLCLREGKEVCDWKSGRQVIYPSTIIREGVMRNGVNDSNHRGVWFYLHWDHPWAPSPEEIVVEIEVVQSSIHKSNKWHHKYCASAEPPGAVSELTRVRALHVPSQLLPRDLIANWDLELST